MIINYHNYINFYNYFLSSFFFGVCYLLALLLGRLVA